MYNNEKKDDFQNFHDQWCEDWIEVWHEVWDDEASFDLEQAPQDGYRNTQPTVNQSLADSELDDARNHHSIDEKFEYKKETISHKDNQVKSKSNYLDYAYELESALNSQIDVSESSQVHYDGANPSLDVVISMD